MKEIPNIVTYVELTTREEVLRKLREPKDKVFVPMCEALEVAECKKCENVIAKPKELTRHRKEDESSTILLSYA